MPRRRKSERVNGPYRRNRGSYFDWQCYIIAPDGTREYKTFENEAAARAWKTAVEAELVTEPLTTEYAIRAFLADKREQGLRDSTLDTYRYALAKFFHEDTPLWAIDELWCRKRYEQMRRELANDTHRNYLAQTKTFLRWCISKRWMGTNPAADIQGVGRRKKGKQQLTVAEARAWDGVANQYARKVLERPSPDELAMARRAIAALMTEYLGVRAMEVCRARVRDVFETHRPGDTLIIPKSKTEAGIRTIEVAAPLCDYLAALCEGQPLDAFLFPAKSSKTGHHDKDWPRSQVHRFCRLAEVTVVCAHSMRGLHDTLARPRGATSHQVAQTLGHANIRVTEEHYAQREVIETENRRRVLQVIRGGKR